MCLTFMCTHVYTSCVLYMNTYTWFTYSEKYVYIRYITHIYTGIHIFPVFLAHIINMLSIYRTYMDISCFFLRHRNMYTYHSSFHINMNTCITSGFCISINTYIHVYACYMMLTCLWIFFLFLNDVVYNPIYWVLIFSLWFVFIFTCYNCF